VAQAILDRQQHFLAYGPMAMKPMALREIAQEVGVHESTVSRVTNNKYMATPCGVFELKYFFSRGLATTGGGECSPTALRGLLQELIAAEEPGRPLSDVDLARQLAEQGFKVARRTVTKYRQLLRIESAERRRAAIAPGGAGHD
jgi:RNA polymerase sigma-54 factor